MAVFSETHLSRFRRTLVIVTTINQEAINIRMSKPLDVRYSLFKRLQTMSVAVIFVATACGVAYAAYRTIEKSIMKDGSETRLNVLLNVPYGNFSLYSGTRYNQLALLRVATDDMEEDPPMHIRQYLNKQDNVGTLKLTLGSDEGMLIPEKPLAHQSYHASTGFSLVSSGTVRTDWGETVYQPPVGRSNFVSNASMLANDNERYQLLLTRDIPVSISAMFGFGESMIDLTGIKLASAYVETGASNSRVSVRTPNKYEMSGCKISAGIGSFIMDGICNLNAARYEFSGGVGFYKLFFNGKLQRSLDASVEVGLGKVSIDIPPDAARVQVYYDENMFSTFNFQGLNKRRDGYATSVGFDQSKSPTLTLRLSSGMGKMEVRYK